MHLCLLVHGLYHSKYLPYYGQAAAGVLHPVLGATLQKGCGQHGEGPEEGHSYDQGTTGQALRREATGPEPVQPPQDKAEGGSSGLLQSSQRGPAGIGGVPVLPSTTRSD